MKTFPGCRRLLLALTLGFLGAGRASAQDLHWANWRGPTGDGLAAADCTPPLTWSEDSNLRWKVELPGLGNSTPIVVGDHIYLTTAIKLESKAGAQPGAPTAEGEHQYVVLALDRASGEEVWRKVVHTAKPHDKGHRTGSHASASISTDGTHLVAFFGSRGLFVLDMQGEVLWSKQLGEMTILANFGEGSTPALHDGTVVVQWDEEGPSFVAAYQVADGKELWREPREVDSTWGSPVVAEVGGKPQVILTGSDTTMAYDLVSGEVIWTCGGMSKNPVNSPLVVDGVAWVMNSYKGVTIQAIVLADAEGSLDPEEDLLWSRNRDAAYVPPPLVVDGLLYYTRDSTGVLTCLDAGTGEVRYAAKRLGGIKRIHACPIATPGRIYFTGREGSSLVIRAGAEFEIVATNVLDDVFDATPAFVGDEIYMRGRSHLYCIAED
ncbi:MAG: outer membrane protein assembly factor BamB [Planctomycetota bacterium]|jgi:outer membrane protein assembly factor BamB